MERDKKFRRSKKKEGGERELEVQVRRGRVGVEDERMKGKVEKDIPLSHFWISAARGMLVCISLVEFW